MPETMNVAPGRVGERHRLAGVHRVDARELPAADQRLHEPATRSPPHRRPGRTAAPRRSSSCCCTAGRSSTGRSPRPGSGSPAATGLLPFEFSSDCASVVLRLRQRQRAEQRQVAAHPPFELRLQRLVARLAAVERVGDVGEARNRPPILERDGARRVVRETPGCSWRRAAGRRRGCRRRRRRAACCASARAAPRCTSSAPGSSGSRSACR